VRSRGWTGAHSISLILLSALLPFTSVAVHGQTQQAITIRLLDFKSGKPIKKLNVDVTLWNGQSTGVLASGITIIAETRAKTDEHGSLVVKVPDPAPEHISIFTPDLAQPSTPRISPGDVLKAGVVVPYRHGNYQLGVTAQAGEIVILNHKLTAADRMRQELP
jgi:hypothetical protein